jgi:hypothetical protein
MLNQSFIKKYLAPLYIEKNIDKMTLKQMAKYVSSKSNRMQNECIRIIENKLDENKLIEFTNFLLEKR